MGNDGQKKYPGKSVPIFGLCTVHNFISVTHLIGYQRSWYLGASEVRDDQSMSKNEPYDHQTSATAIN